MPTDEQVKPVRINLGNVRTALDLLSQRKVYVLVAEVDKSSAFFSYIGEPGIIKPTTFEVQLVSSIHNRSYIIEVDGEDNYDIRIGNVKRKSTEPEFVRILETNSLEAELKDRHLSSWYFEQEGILTYAWQAQISWAAEKIDAYNGKHAGGMSQLNQYRAISDFVSRLEANRRREFDILARRAPRVGKWARATSLKKSDKKGLPAPSRSVKRAYQ